MPAPRQNCGGPPMLMSKGTEQMVIHALPTSITEVEDAETVAWLMHALAAARQRSERGPAPEALERVRLRVLAAIAAREDEGRIAA